MRFHSVAIRVQAVNTKADLLVPANPPILDGVNDLTSLSYLNEPSILHDLHQRYSNDQVCEPPTYYVRLSASAQVSTQSKWRTC